MTTILAFLLDSFVVQLSNIARESVELFQDKCQELVLVARLCQSKAGSHPASVQGFGKIAWSVDYRM